MASAFPSLAAPQLEDSMEVSSSPAGNVFDNDIDIDFEDYTGGVNLTDDERMLEDGDPTRPATATDDMMDDDEHANPVVEEVMQDDPPHDQSTRPEPDDEELIDYDDDDDDDINTSFFNDTTLQNTETGFTAPAETAPEQEITKAVAAQEEDLLFDEDADLEQVAPLVEDTEAAAPDAPAHKEYPPEAQPASQTGLDGDAPAIEAQEADGAGEECAITGEPAVTGGDDLFDYDDLTAVEPEPAHVDDDTAASLRVPPQLPGTLDTTATDVLDGPPTPTDTGLPSMTITFGDYSMPMFKSRNQPDGLLKDDNLASIGLSALMQKCRERLQVKFDVTIPASHDILLGFDRLGLMLVECDSSAFDTCLNDIIQVWEHLHRNDDAEEVPTLSVTLTSQPKFSSTLEFLQKAASQGQGISSFAPPKDVDNEQYHDDEHAFQEGQEPDAGDEQYEEHDDADAPEYAEEFEHQAGEGEEHAEDDGPAEEPTEDYQAIEFPEGGYQDEFEYGEYNPDEEYSNPEVFAQDEAPGTNAEAADAPEDQDQDQPEGEVHAETDEKNPAETVKPDSAASSTTVRGDTANDTTGEYDEDLIDYSDDDDDLIGRSEHGTGNGQDQFLLFDDDADVDGAEHASHLNVAGNTSDAHEGSTANPTADNQITEQPNADGATDDHNGANHGYNPEEELIDYDDDDDTYDGADLIDYDDQDDGQVGEDEEQFHTALDVLEDPNAEHGSQVVNAPQTSGEPREQVIDEDDIGFQDDYPEPEITTTEGSTNSPLGKRSFEDLVGEEELLDYDDDEPEPKKARSD